MPPSIHIEKQFIYLARDKLESRIWSFFSNLAMSAVFITLNRLHTIVCTTAYTELSNDQVSSYLLCKINLLNVWGDKWYRAKCLWSGVRSLRVCVCSFCWASSPLHWTPCFTCSYEDKLYLLSSLQMLPSLFVILCSSHEVALTVFLVFSQTEVEAGRKQIKTHTSQLMIMTTDTWHRGSGSRITYKILRQRSILRPLCFTLCIHNA